MRINWQWFNTLSSKRTWVRGVCLWAALNIFIWNHRGYSVLSYLWPVKCVPFSLQENPDLTTNCIIYFIYLATFLCSIKKNNTAIPYAHSNKLDILLICYLKVRFLFGLFLYSPWYLVNGLSTLIFGTLGSFTPFTNRHMFNKHTYRDNTTRIDRFNYFWRHHWAEFHTTVSG